jgi:hypothetical protein
LFSGSTIQPIIKIKNQSSKSSRRLSPVAVATLSFFYTGYVAASE